MSGHSKWSTIKRQKGAADAKRGQAFTKISNAITIAVKQGGGVSDPTQNPRLRLAIEMARRGNMPKENIQRAIDRAKNKGEGGVEEVIYEGFAPGGVSIIIEAATDNTNRTTSEIKSLFNKSGASFAQPGAVSYQFIDVGEVIVLRDNKTLDDMIMLAADAGADDVIEDNEGFTIYTSPSELTKIKENLEKSGLVIEDAFLSKKPTSTVKLESTKEGSVMSFLSTLKAMDDVQKVYSNIG